MLRGVQHKNIIHNKFILFICIFLCVLVCLSAFCINQKASAVTTWQLPSLNSSAQLFSDNSGVYVVSYGSSSMSVNYIIGNSYERRTIKTEGQIQDVAVNNGNVYALSVNDGIIIITKYVYNSDSMYMYYLNDIKINMNYKFCISNDRVYFAYKDGIVTTFYCYSIFGEKIYSFTVDEVTDFSINQQGSTLYIISQNKVYTVSTMGNYQPQLVLSTVYMYSEIHMCSDVIFDDGGSIIDANNKVTIETDCPYNKLNGGIVNSYYCKYNNGTIFGYNAQGYEYQLYYTGLNEQAQMCSYNNCLYLISNSGSLIVIDSNELSFPDNNQNNSSVTTPTNSSNVQSSSIQQNSNVDQNSKLTGKFSIDNYQVDTAQNMIYNIPFGTTIAQFKNNLTAVGYNVEFYNKDNVKKTSGKVGTNFTMVVTHNNTEYARYSLSVKGDLTGEGSVNSSDVKLISKYLMDGYILNNAQLNSADCNNDGKINGTDLLKIAKNNV